MKKYKNMFWWYEKHPKINMALGLDFTSTPFCFIIVKLTPFWSSSSSSSTSSSDVIDFWVLKGKMGISFTWNIVWNVISRYSMYINESQNFLRSAVVGQKYTKTKFLIMFMWKEKLEQMKIVQLVVVEMQVWFFPRLCYKNLVSALWQSWRSWRATKSHDFTEIFFAFIII